MECSQTLHPDGDRITIPGGQGTNEGFVFLPCSNLLHVAGECYLLRMPRILHDV